MRKPLGKITPLTKADLAIFDEMRIWLLAPLDDTQKNLYEGIEGKLLVIQAVLQANRLGHDNVFELQALGVAFGDALGQKLGLSWMISDGAAFGREPVLNLPGMSLAISAFTAIQKRVVQGAPVEIYSLFNAFCQSAEQIIRPKRSLLERLFGKRIT